ncbi:MAG: hypothetical protein HKP12_02475 [Gammaproteobacteria bacterium]|nr:hypothetical protein [Gammaproteobacteria bacterium]
MTEKNKPANKKVVKKKVAKKTAGKVTGERRTAIKDRRADDKIMPGLLRNLEGVFEKIHRDNLNRDRAQEQIAEEFASHMQDAFNNMHDQLEEREQLLDAKLKSIDRTQSYQLKRVKLLSIPVAALSMIAVVYLFYVVRVMETSMTSMSQDMHQITAYMDSMSHDTHSLTANTTKMTANTAEMNAQMETMNGNVGNMNAQMETMNGNIGNMNATVGNMRYDVYNMSRTVSPAMSSVNRFMP